MIADSRQPVQNASTDNWPGLAHPQSRPSTKTTQMLTHPGVPGELINSRPHRPWPAIPYPPAWRQSVITASSPSCMKHCSQIWLVCHQTCHRITIGPSQDTTCMPAEPSSSTNAATFPCAHSARLANTTCRTLYRPHSDDAPPQNLAIPVPPVIGTVPAAHRVRYGRGTTSDMARSPRTDTPPERAAHPMT